jgi:hypothetical protein
MVITEDKKNVKVSVGDYVIFSVKNKGPASIDMVMSITGLHGPCKIITIKCLKTIREDMCIDEKGKSFRIYDFQFHENYMKISKKKAVAMML